LLADGVHDLQKIFKGPGEAIIFRNGHNVAVAELVEHPIQLGPDTLRSADLVREHLASSYRCQRVGLSI